jgi:hypothetical protein
MLGFPFLAGFARRISPTNIATGAPLFFDAGQRKSLGNERFHSMPQEPRSGRRLALLPAHAPRRHFFPDAEKAKKCAPRTA